MKNFDFLKKKNIAFIVSAVLLVAGLLSFIIGGFNMGVDFTGGSKITLHMEKDPSGNLDTIEKCVEEVVGADKLVSVIQSSSNKKDVIVTVKSVESFDKLVAEKIASLYGVSVGDVGDKETTTTDKGEEYASVSFEVKAEPTVKEDDLKAALNALDDKIISEINKDEKLEVADSEINTISKNRASAQTKTALIAAAIAVILMLVYITFRFKQIASGLASVACLFFNLFIMFTFYSIFRWEMTLDIIPACLTILGYSINATIVIFDRIRENSAKVADFDTAANDGVHSTMLRSVNTTITTLITIVLVYILGVTSIKAFALPLIIGVIAGLFSSVFLSAPIWSVLRKWFKVEEKAIAKKQSAKK